MSVSRGQEADVTPSRLGAHVQALIPGLPDEITLSKVATKLPSMDIDTLFFVSRGWFHAIRSRQVYDARVRAHSMETLFISNYEPAENVHAITLYPTSENPRRARLRLPSLTSPYFGRDVSPSGRSVMEDGKVYIFEGLDCKVHVMDVAGHRQWKRCANMLHPKVEFGCGTIDGKIYIFGGGVSHESSYGTKLYNPDENTWSEIRTILSLRSSLSIHRAAIERREVFFPVGRHTFFYPETLPRALANFQPPRNSDPLEVYNPIRNEWRVVEPVGTAKEIMFVAAGKFFSMSPLGVQIYDFHRNSWGDRRSFSFVGFAPVNPVNLVPVAILTKEVEVLAIVDWPNAGSNRSCVIQSRGLGNQNREIVWYKPEYSDKQPDHLTMYLIGSIRL